ncbi:MAG TPA: RNA-binding S4 domain-containing protein [bacterium]|nr:RNA-binding S4 domain-containing protein [bacterium]
MPSLTFTLKDDFIELNKLLKVMDLCESSGAGKALVASGVVKVNGQVELRKACKIRAGSVVTVGEATITVAGADVG